MTTTAGIQAPWRIHDLGERTAQVGELLILLSAPRRGEDISWWITKGQTVLYHGVTRFGDWRRVGQGGRRYSAHVRQAMFEAEQMAARLAAGEQLWPRSQSRS